MKKILCGALISAAVLLPQTVLADEATYPVHLDGREVIGEAVVRDGTSYLPMRTLLEALGAEVHWDEKSNTVYAQGLDGSRIELPLTDDVEENFIYISYTEDGENWYRTSVSLAEKLPLVRDGRVYLPVRVISEALSYHVEWLPWVESICVEQPKLIHCPEYGGTYRLNLLNGELSYSYGGSEDVLGVLDLKSLYNPSWYAPQKFTVEHTEGANYLFKANGLGSGALTFDYKVSAWMSSGGGDAVTCYTNTILPVDLPEPMQVGEEVWLPCNGKAVAVNENTGEVTEYLMSEIYGEASSAVCYWTDGRLLLIGDGADFDIYDTETKKLTDLQAVLAEPMKAQVNAFMLANSVLDEQYLNDHYWNAFGNMFSVDPCPAMTFDKFADGKLYFTLNCSYWDKDIKWAKQTYPLVYELPA